MSKEDKFFESLRDFAGFTGRVGFLLEERQKAAWQFPKAIKSAPISR